MSKKLKYLGNATNAQIRWGNHNDPRNLLEKNNMYDVDKIEIHSWHTKVFLKGYSGSFNSIWFTK